MVRYASTLTPQAAGAHSSGEIANLRLALTEHCEIAGMDQQITGRNVDLPMQSVGVCRLAQQSVSNQVKPNGSPNEPTIWLQMNSRDLPRGQLPIT
ncbi:MAG: hypothetical protein WB660_13335, partial [Candidatus Sulfotelmatobacter sp.]